MSRAKDYEVQDDKPVLYGKAKAKPFLWNPETKEVMGRDCKNWCYLLVFYVILYLFLAGFFAGMLAIFLKFLDEDRPMRSYYSGGEKHPMMAQPGMAMKPLQEDEWRSKVPLIKLKLSDPASFAAHVEDLNTMLEEYTTDFAVSECGESSNSLCTLNRSHFQSCDGVNDPNYGYSTGEPCVLLRINKVIGWAPSTASSNPDSSLIPDDRWNSTHIPVACVHDTNQAGEFDCQNCFGSPEYLPPNGFPASCFPYCGKVSSDDYVSPAVMVKFRGITIGETVSVVCRVFADNLVYNRKDNAASVRFAILIEN